MTETLKIIIIAAAFLVIGYLLALAKRLKDRKEAVKDSRGKTRASIIEELSPLFPGFPGKLSEARHIGKPIDFLVFEGMDEGNITKIKFVEVKTGQSSNPTTSERQIEDIITEAEEMGGKVEWYTYNPDKK